MLTATLLGRVAGTRRGHTAVRAPTETNVFRRSPAPTPITTDAEEHFPRIESATDSFGNTVRGPGPTDAHTGQTLRPGDQVDFAVTGWDPQRQPYTLEWSAHTAPGTYSFRQFVDRFIWKVTDETIGDPIIVTIRLTSGRPYHRLGSAYDDQVQFWYRVVPARGLASTTLHTLAAVGGTTSTCSCGWRGPGWEFQQHQAEAPRAARVWTGATDPSNLADEGDVWIKG